MCVSVFITEMNGITVNKKFKNILTGRVWLGSAPFWRTQAIRYKYHDICSIGITMIIFILVTSFIMGSTNILTLKISKQARRVNCQGSHHPGGSSLRTRTGSRTYGWGVSLLNSVASVYFDDISIIFTTHLKSQFLGEVEKVIKRH